MKRLGIVVLSACMLLAVAAAPAAAAPATPTAVPAASSARVVTPAVTQVQLWPSEPGGIGLIVTAELATGTPLPVTVRLPLPAGAEVTWAGEIAGATGAGDIERSHTVEAGVGGQVVVVRVEKYSELQVEAVMGEPKPVGDKLGATLEWVQSAPTGSLVFGVKMVSTATDVVIQPAPPGPASRSDVGEQLYGFAPRTVKTGEKVTLAVTYRQGSTSTGTSGSTTSPLLIFLIALLVVAVVAFLVVATRVLAERSAARRDADDDTRPVRRAASKKAAEDGEGPPAEADNGDEDTFDLDWK